MIRLMINRAMSIAFIACILIYANACKDSKNEEVAYNLKISNVDLVDVGRVKPYKFNFESKRINDSIWNCKIHTGYIKTHDKIKSIIATLKGDNLNIEIISYPYDWDCDDNSCYTMHDLTFNLVGITNGTYNLSIDINNNESKQFRYEMK